MKFKKKGREYALQFLFQFDFKNISQQDLENISIDEKIIKENIVALNTKLNDSSKNFSYKLIKGCLSHFTELKNLIEKLLDKGSFERVPKVDLIILLIGFFELNFEGNVTKAVIIDSSKKIAHKYGGPKSAQFVHGILNRYQEL